MTHLTLIAARQLNSTSRVIKFSKPTGCLLLVTEGSRLSSFGLDADLTPLGIDEFQELNRISALDVHPDEPLCLIVGSSPNVWLWNLEERHLIGQWAFPGTHISKVAFIDNGRKALVAAGPGTCMCSLLDLADGTVRPLTEAGDENFGFAVAPNQKTYAVAHADQSAVSVEISDIDSPYDPCDDSDEWDYRFGERSVGIDHGSVYEPMFNSDGFLLTIAHHYPAIYSWPSRELAIDFRDDQPHHSDFYLNQETSWCNSVFSGETLLCGSNTGEIWLWDVPSGEEIERIKAHVGKVNMIATNADGSLLASVGADNWLKLWGLNE